MHRSAPVKKAYLLAGGRGERLRPLTLSMPKCLVPVAGQPMLALWLDLLARHGVTDVLVNVSQHIDQVHAFLAGRSKVGPHVTLVHEPEPIGNAGTVLANRTFVRQEDDFWICYSDNVTDANLTAMAEFHRSHSSIVTMGLFHAPVPEQAGIVDVDESGVVRGFEEKPLTPKSSLANAGIYLARRALLDAIPPRAGVVDFGRDVFASLVGRIHGFVIEEYLLDIGTPSALERASREWPAVREGVSHS